MHTLFHLHTDLDVGSLKVLEFFYKRTNNDRINNVNLFRFCIQACRALVTQTVHFLPPALGPYGGTDLLLWGRRK